MPVALAAWTLGVPILVYLPDIEPGLAVRFIARLASRVAVTVEDSRAYFPSSFSPIGGEEKGGKVVVTGYPVRSEFYGLDREQGRTALGLMPDELVLLIFGGSRGARSINQAVSKVLRQLLEVTQIIHVSGEMDWSRVKKRREALPAALQDRYHTFPYLHEMGNALAAADLAVCRAGASTLGELPFFGLPAVLVPYPHTWRYQKVNAAWLVEQGAAVVLEDERLDRELLPTVRQLLMNPQRLARMQEQALSLARRDAATRLASELRSLSK